MARRFVAVGDSFTEGLHDESGTAGRPRGWADRVAAALARLDGGLQYANLAIRGRLLDQVVVGQIPHAATLQPDLLSFHAGPNDVLRPGVDVADVVHRYDAAVARCRSVTDDLLLFTVIARTDARRGVAGGLARRFAIFNDGVRGAARRHGARLVDVGAVPALRDPRLWHEDRLHLNPEGHRRVAAAVLEALGVDRADLVDGAPGWWREPLPAPPPRGRAGRLREESRWVSRHLFPWVVRRVRGVSSGDGLAPKHPALVEVPPRP